MQYSNTHMYCTSKELLIVHTSSEVIPSCHDFSVKDGEKIHNSHDRSYLRLLFIYGPGLDCTQPPSSSHHEQALDNSGEEKLPFKRQKQFLSCFIAEILSQMQLKPIQDFSSLRQPIKGDSSKVTVLLIQNSVFVFHQTRFPCRAAVERQ